MSRKYPHSTLRDPALLGHSITHAFVKLRPTDIIRNPILFTVGAGSVLSSFFTLRAALAGEPFAIDLFITVWLWLTILSGNFAEAAAEGRGRSQAESLRKSKTQTAAKRIPSIDATNFKTVRAADLRLGDLVIAEAGDVIPADGDVVRGIATVDESSITGESAPVIRESGGDRCAVTGGTRVLSDRIVIEIRSNPGESFLDRMIGVVEGAMRQKTPNEIALNILLTGMTLVFLVVCVTLQGLAAYSGTMIPMTYLIALLVALIPTTIGGLISTIGISGMDRLVAHNVIAKSSRAVEAAGDIDTLLLDKTGTITLGNRMASAFIPVGGASIEALAEAAMLSSLADETPEGKSIVRLAEEKFGWQASQRRTPDMRFFPFTAHARMSGVDIGSVVIRKGAPDSILLLSGNSGSEEIIRTIERVAKTGGTPLLVSRDKNILGVIHLKDIVKPGIHQRFMILRRMGIRTVMITGDNPITAAAIAAESGVDDFLAEASPEKKLDLIRREQSLGKLVAMCGDGANDAPALAQADVGVAMNTGTMAAREAGNMIDLDSDPTKLIEIVIIGKQILMSRGSLTIFSLASDIAKYLAIIPALFASAYPGMQALNVMNLASPESAVLSTIIFNALTIVFFMPLALRGIQYTPASADILLRRNLAIYGAGGLAVPFIGIKIVDMIINAFKGA